MGVTQNIAPVTINFTNTSQGDNLTVSISTSNLTLTDGSGTYSPFRLIQPSTNTVYSINNTYLTQGAGVPSYVDFVFTASGDLSSTSEYWQVFDEDGMYLTDVGQYNGCDCCGNTSCL